MVENATNICAYCIGYENDVAELLAEVKRLRAENGRLEQYIVDLEAAAVRRLLDSTPDGMAARSAAIKALSVAVGKKRS